MTAKERMLIAMTGGQPDRVPCAPDISTMIPQRLTGKPFWDIELYGNPPLWKAYIEAVKHFGIDGWFIYGGLDFKSDSQMTIGSEIVSTSDERIVRKHWYDTPAGRLTGETTFFIADSASPTEKILKDIERDFDKIKYLYPTIYDSDNSSFELMRSEFGDLGALGITVTYPGFQQWFPFVQGGIEALTYAYMDYPDIIEEWRQMEHKHQIRIMELSIAAKPDFILLGGSGSITLQSPELFKQFCVPTIKEQTRMAKAAGIPTMLHSCGKEKALVDILAVESDLDCVNPLEVPPMGDCDLAELKREYGSRFSFMGNIHTTDVMLYGTVKDVEDTAKKCIDDAGAGGGYILSTGDQCGRDTPDENIFKLVEVAQTYGKY